MTTDSVQIVPGRRNGRTFKICSRRPADFGDRWRIEYGTGTRYEGRVIIDAKPDGSLKWLPHTEPRSGNDYFGWPADLEEPVCSELRRLMNGGWSA